MRLYEDKINPHKKIPKFTAEVGSILTTGSTDKKIKIRGYEKELPPLTLKFTLEKIESAVELLKGDFISKVIELKDFIVNREFETVLLPKVMDTIERLEFIREAVISEEESNSPLNVISDILELVE